MMKFNAPLIISILYGVILSIVLTYIGIHSNSLQISFFGIDNSTQIIKTSGAFSIFIYFFIVLGIYKTFELVIKKGN